MKLNLRWLFILTTTLLSCVSCGGGGNSNPTSVNITDCSIQGQNQFVYDVMKDIYLYYDQLPVLNPNDYNSPSELLEDLKVAPDRFSGIADQQSRQNFFENGTYNGLGYSFNNDGDSYTIRFVFDDSPAGRAGLQRSDRILSIDGISVTEINNRGGFGTFFSDYQVDDTLTLSVIQLGGAATNIDLTLGLVRINTVISAEVININNLKVGYLALTSFLEPTKAELATAFSKFAQNNIDELVLDLRYNGGGQVDTSQILASYIAGDDALGANVTRLVFNDKNSDLNSSYPFLSLTNSVDLNRLYVLTLENTCSASELVINTMSPVGIDVITIGQTTCGKPVGSRAIDFCDKTLVPISFDVVNDLGQGGYFDGIDANCAAIDNPNTLLANINEGMLSTALHHIENGQCPTANKLLKLAPKTLQNTKKTLSIMDSVF